MGQLDPILFLPLGLAGVVACYVLARLSRARGRARRRVVEKPNSHHTAPAAREIVSTHRWHSIALDRMHEINRQEVVRLLALLEATSPEALDPRERGFLDRMMELST